MNITRKLEALERPIHVGVIGSGIFGSQVVHAVESAPGMKTAAIADARTDKATTTLRRTGVQENEIESIESHSGLRAVIESGRRAVAAVGDVIIGEEIDVIVEATGVPNVSARHAFKSLHSGTHFVNVSVESDTVCGPLLSEIAEQNDVVYSLAYGDQPALIVDLCDWARTAGFEIVAAGKSTPEMDHTGTPDDAIERYGHITSFGDGIDPDPVMYNSFLDGTKAAVESVAAANALELPIDETGMHKPTVPLAEIPETFRPTKDGGILSRTGVIDSVTSTDVGFSVFVVTRTGSEQLCKYFAHRQRVPTSEDGQYQVFVRPHHFAPETTVSIARAALRGEPTGAPTAHVAEVTAAAKRNLTPGDEIDGGGGYTIYGLAEDAKRAAQANYVPLELLDGATVVSPVEQHEVITYDDVELDTDQFIYHLRQLQEQL